MALTEAGGGDEGALGERAQDLANFHRVFLAWCKRRGLENQTTLSKKSGLSRQQISKYTQGTALPSLRGYKALARVFGTSVSDLRDGVLPNDADDQVGSQEGATILTRLGASALLDSTALAPGLSMKHENAPDLDAIASLRLHLDQRLNLIQEALSQTNRALEKLAQPEAVKPASAPRQPKAKRQ